MLIEEAEGGMNGKITCLKMLVVNKKKKYCSSSWLSYKKIIYLFSHFILCALNNKLT